MARCRVPAPVAGGGTVNPRLPHGDISRVLHRVLVLTGGGGHVFTGTVHLVTLLLVHTWP